MTRYFRLVDDVRIRRRWHLGEVVDSAGAELELDGGVRVAATTLGCALTRPGVALEFCLTNFNGPVAVRHLAEAISDVGAGDIQRLPLVIPGHPGFEALNVLRVLSCVDETRSEYVRWTPDDHRADLAGSYRSVSTLRLRQNDLPENADIFRVEGWLVGLVVSERMRDAMEAAGCRGARFIDLA